MGNPAAATAPSPDNGARGTRGQPARGRGRGSGRRKGGTGRPDASGGGSTHKKDTLILAAFPPGADKEFILKLKIPPAGNNSTKVNKLFKAVGTYSRDGSTGGNLAADEIETGVANDCTDVSMDPFKKTHLIQQDGLVPTPEPDYVTLCNPSDGDEDPNVTAALVHEEFIHLRLGAGLLLPPGVTMLRFAEVKTKGGNGGLTGAGEDAAGEDDDKEDFQDALSGGATTTAKFRTPATKPSQPTPAVAPRRRRPIRPMTASERAEVPPYRLMTAAELRAAPSYKEMSTKMAKTHVSVSDAQRYKILPETQQKERDNYKHDCRKIHDRVMVLLPQTAVDKLEARSDWRDISHAADILRLRSAVLAAATNSDVRLYTPV